MPFRWLADVALLGHLAFVAFAVLGALLVLRWPKLAWVHLPAACWGVLIEFAGWICPLTPLENTLRVRGGGAGYAGGFIDHYITTVLYPSGLTRTAQVGLGSLALLINVLLYRQVARRWRRPPRLENR
jgi:Protein of Unknown function (DUF2784)